jgi:hypothetical protein
VAVLTAIVSAACDSGSGPTTPPTPTTITVTAISPATGSTFGGTAVTITGTGFVAGVTVQIGGTAATDVVVTNSTTITAKTAAHVEGAGNVVVAAGTVTGSLPSGFTFVTPAVGPNSPPTVGSISVTAPRPKQPKTLASVGDRMTLTASINDAETPLSGLTIQWSSLPSIGTFTGTGASVQWTAPASTSSPQTVILMLTVLEQYQEPDSSGLPVQREHRVQKTTSVKVHDTVKEVSDMAVDFLELFSDSSITNPALVLHNFSQTCDGGKGYEDEYGDVVISREKKLILTHDITPPSVFQYAFGSTKQACTNKGQTPGDVCVEVPVHWTDRDLDDDEFHDVRGTDYVTGVYENAAWRLCHSRWDAIDTLTGKPVQMDFDRSRIIIKGPKDR